MVCWLLSRSLFGFRSVLKILTYYYSYYLSGTVAIFLIFRSSLSAFIISVVIATVILLVSTVGITALDGTLSASTFTSHTTFGNTSLDPFAQVRTTVTLTPESCKGGLKVQYGS